MQWDADAEGKRRRNNFFFSFKMPKAGDKVRVITKDRAVEGILMPNEETDSVVIKLDSGYNIGIEKNSVKKIEKKMEKAGKGDMVLGRDKSEKRDRLEISHVKKVRKARKNPELPNITILHTGGTIASKVDYRTGAVYSSFSPEDLLGMFPELGEIANFSSRLISNMWSDDLRFRHFGAIAEAIEKEIKGGADGIIVGIGTDNLASASAALAFIVEQTPVPVILVGAQRSSDRGSSDAAMNLICAAEFIAKSDFSGVAVCMHEGMGDRISAIMPACKTRKMHSSRRDAFKVINDEVIARVDYEAREVRFVKGGCSLKDKGAGEESKEECREGIREENKGDKKDRPKEDKDKGGRKDRKKGLIIKPGMEEKVALLKVHVNMFPEQFEFFKGYKGLVIEGTGMGHTPGQVPNEICRIHKDIYPAIKRVIDSGCIIVMTTQCIFGRVHMHVYSKGADLAKLGIISGEDMLAETALVKLSWLLGNYEDREEIKRLIGANLRGEINQRIEPDEYLVNT